MENEIACKTKGLAGWQDLFDFSFSFEWLSVQHADPHTMLYRVAPMHARHFV